MLARSKSPTDDVGGDELQERGKDRSGNGSTPSTSPATSRNPSTPRRSAALSASTPSNIRRTTYGRVPPYAQFGHADASSSYSRVAAVLESSTIAAARSGRGQRRHVSGDVTSRQRVRRGRLSARNRGDDECFRDDQLRGGGRPRPGRSRLRPSHGLLGELRLSVRAVHAQIPVLVAGKGEIDWPSTVTGCWTGDDFPATITVSGGNGRYAGASGSGLLGIPQSQHHRPPSRETGQ